MCFGVKTVPTTVLRMGAMNIPWCNKLQYLGVMLVGGKSFNVESYKIPGKSRCNP